MVEFWNEFELKPALLTIPIKCALFTDDLQPIFSKFLQQQSNAVHEDLAQSAALLSRLIARRKNSFRKMVVFKFICKLNSALCRLLRVNLPRILENFSSTLPDAVSETIKVEIPSRNNFDFVLIRLLGVYKIHQRIIECCLESAVHIAKMLRTNFFIEINTLLLAVIAKIRNNSNIICKDYIKYYRQLLQYRLHFPQNNKYTFLPNDFKFPQKLDEIGTTIEVKAEDKGIDDAQLPITLKKSATPVVSKLKKKCDMGTVVNRKISGTPPLLIVEQLQTVEAIKKFISSESKERATLLQKSKTKKLLNHEWQGAIRLFEKKLKANEKEKAVSFFKKFLNSKI